MQAVIICMHGHFCNVVPRTDDEGQMMGISCSSEISISDILLNSVIASKKLRTSLVELSWDESVMNLSDPLTWLP